MALIEIALERALSAYRGKRDKAGQAYVLHPLRLMAKMHDEISRLSRSFTMSLRTRM
ncbi:hypothetical protein ACUVZD_000074 [Pseudomonas aeruginosa]